MSRIQEYIDILRGERSTPLKGSHPKDKLLLQVLIHAAFADRVLTAGEIELLRKLLPGKNNQDITNKVLSEAKTDIDLIELQNSFPDSAERGLISELAESIMVADQEVVTDEVHFIDRLRSALGT